MNKHPITEELKHKSILDSIDDIIEFTISKDATSINIAETVEYYAYADLTKEEFGQLIAALQGLYFHMKNNPQDIIRGAEYE